VSDVLHIVAGLGAHLGGPSRSVPLLVRALAREGLDVAVATPEGEAESAVSPEAAALAEVGVPRRALPREASEVRRLVGTARLVHVHGCWLPVTHRVHVAAKRAGIPVVLSPRGMLEPWALRHKRLKKLAAWLLYERRDVRNAAVLHATAELERAGLARLGLINPIAVVPNPIEVPALDALPARPRASDRRRRALFLSRIHPKKGIDLLLEAWSKVRPPGWELVIVGTGDRGYCAGLEAQVRQIGLTGEVRFAGHLEGTEKWAQYRASDLFVLPTRSENFGMVVAEALAAETPVIVTDAAPWAALPARGCGWCVPVSAEALAAALEEAVGASDEQREAMGVEGRRFVERSFSPTAVAGEIRDLYRWVLGEVEQVPPFVHLPAAVRRSRSMRPPAAASGHP